MGVRQGRSVIVRSKQRTADGHPESLACSLSRVVDSSYEIRYGTNNSHILQHRSTGGQLFQDMVRRQSVTHSSAQGRNTPAELESPHSVAAL